MLSNKTTNQSYVFCFLLFLIIGWRMVNGTMVKVGLEPVNQNSILKRQSSPTACSDYTLVNKDSLTLPSQYKNPWESEMVNVFDSQIASDGMMNEMYLRKIPGLDGTTIGEMLEYFNASKCLCFPFGGSVRDQFLGAIPGDLDMEISCSADKFLELCKAMWPSDQCKKSSSGILHVGTTSDQGEAVDARNWDDVFFDGVDQLEYTTNSLAYDSNFNDVVIDLPGTGVNDTCNKKIRIPGPANTISWNNWYQPTKGYRYWKLRAKGYTAFDKATSSFIVTEVGEEIQNDSSFFIRYFCRSILGGVYTAPDECEHSDCAKQKLYEDLLQMDLGFYWDSSVIHGFTCDSNNNNIATTDNDNIATTEDDDIATDDDSSENFATFASNSSFLLITLGLMTVFMSIVY